MTVPSLFHGHMPRHQNVSELSRFLALKGYKMNHEKLLLKNSFPKNKEKNFINRFNARATRYTHFREHVLTICASSTLLMPSTNHLRAILSLSIVRVRRKNFSFSKIYNARDYHLLSKRHLKTILSTSAI